MLTALITGGRLSVAMVAAGTVAVAVAVAAASGGSPDRKGMVEADVPFSYWPSLSMSWFPRLH